MRIPGRKALRDALRWGRSRTGWRAVILGYHRVADESWDPFDLAIDTASFTRQLEVLSQRARPMRLGDLARALTEGERPDRAVVVTFDDGYVNNLEVAEPLLRRFEVPATLFAIAGGHGAETWWDELARLVRPDREAAIDMARELMPLPAERIRERLDELRRRTTGGRPPEDATHRLMTAEELKRLAAGGTFEIASHTVSHPALVAQPPELQRTEIFESRRTLQTVTGEDVPGFSYPNGSREPRTVALVREAGYLYACNSERDVVRSATDVFDLPRFWLPPMDGDRFARWLERWLG